MEEAAEVCLDRGSWSVMSVVERETGREEAVGGVPLLEARCIVTREGSVVRREVGGWKGVLAGVEEDVGAAEVPTVAKELVGLPGPEMLKSKSRGELGLELVLGRTLSRNCWRASSLLRCWCSDWRRLAGGAVSDADPRSLPLLFCELLTTGLGIGCSARLAERELP